jgi:predicted nucleic acid-binding protein
MRTPVRNSESKQCGADRLLTEDLNPGQKIAGILIVNPFAEA